MKIYIVSYAEDDTPDGYAREFFSSKREATKRKAELVEDVWDALQETNRWMDKQLPDSRTRHTYQDARNAIDLRETTFPTDKKGILDELNLNNGLIS